MDSCESPSIESNKSIRSNEYEDKVMDRKKWPLNGGCGYQSLDGLAAYQGGRDLEWI